MKGIQYFACSAQIAPFSCRYITKIPKQGVSPAPGSMMKLRLPASCLYFRHVKAQGNKGRTYSKDGTGKADVGQQVLF